MEKSRRTIYHEDPMSFLRDCVFTRDEADPKNPIKQWPSLVCGWPCSRYHAPGVRICPGCGDQPLPLEYVEALVRQWHKGDPRIMIVPKPRRFKVSWLFSALHLWLAISRAESAIYFQSRTEEDSSFLVDRVEFIADHVPEELLPKVGYTRQRKPPKLTLENGSFIHGKPEGADAMRGVTASAILLDEAAFWAQPRASYNAIRPLVENGCRLTIVSSAAAGFFRQLVEGTL